MSSFDEDMYAPHLGPVEGMGFDDSYDGYEEENRSLPPPQSKCWKHGDNVCLAMMGHRPDGTTVRVGAAVSVPAIVIAVEKKLSKAGYGKLAPLIAKKVGKFVAANKLKDEVSGRYERAATMNPVDFVMGEDYAKDAQAAVPLALDVISLFYPEAGVAMKVVNAANNGNPTAQQAVKQTATQAQQGNPQAVNAWTQLEQAALNLGKLQKAVQDGQKQGVKSTDSNTEYVESRGLYERGLG